MGKLLPVLIALAGLGAGIGAGFALRPAPEAAETAGAADAHGAEGAAAEHGAASPDCVPADGHSVTAKLPDPASLPAYVKLANQFVVPLMDPDRVRATVILTLSLEVPQGSQDAVYAIEPKLRDAFLRVLFDHANAGGFDGNFLTSAGLDDLRDALLESAVASVGPAVKQVLIVDLVKQEI